MNRFELIEYIFQNVSEYYGDVNESKMRKILGNASTDDLYRVANMIDRFGVGSFELVKIGN